MVGKPQDLNQGWPSSQSLIELLDELKHAGYNIGVEQYIAAQDLLLALIAQSEQLDEPEILSSLLGPLLCSSPTEQIDFQYRFHQWAKRIGLTAGPVKQTDAQAEKLDQALRDVKRRQRRWVQGILAFLVALVLSFGLFQIWPPFDGTQPDETTSDLTEATPAPPPDAPAPPAPVLPDAPDGEGTLGLEACQKKPPLILEGRAKVNSVAFSPDGSMIASASDDSIARLWDRSGKALATLSGHEGAVNSVVFSPDGATLATRGEDWTARLWDRSGKALATLSGHEGAVNSVVFSPDGATLATSGEGGTARLWGRSGEPLATLTGHQGRVDSVVFSPDGATLATSGEDGTARLWDRSGEPLATLTGHQGRVDSVVFSPDGAMLATSGEDGTARLWDRSGELLATLEVHEGRVDSVVFSPDGATLATSGEDDAVHLWDVQSIEYLVPLNHDGPVNSVTFSPSGQMVATASADGTARLWDVGSGEEKARLNHKGDVNAVVFSPDGKTVVTASADGTVQLWDVTTGKPISQLFWEFLQDEQVQLGLLLLLLLPLLLAWSGSWFWQAHQFLVRRGAAQAPELERISIAGIDENLFPAVTFLRIAQGLRRRMQIASLDLDISKTARETAGRVGWFTPVYGYRQVLPEYLVLIDRTSPDDHQARFVEAMLDRLVENGVFISGYFFKDDPRICFSITGSGQPCRLQELVGKYGQDRLIIFSDSEGLLSSQMGDLESWMAVFSAWSDRAVLTPEPSQYWGYQERQLAQQFTVLPLTIPGLVQFIHSLDLDRSPSAPSGGVKAPLPSALREQPRRWLQREPPDSGSVEQMLSSLQRYLGPDGYYWFSACAVFPLLHWDVTVYLGQSLQTEDGQTLLETQRLLDMVRLPWFRHAYMPDWLRIRLIAVLPRQQEQKIRRVLEELLVAAVQGKVSRFQLEIARKHKSVISWLVAPLLGRLSRSVSRDSPLVQDYIFRDFMVGLKPSRLSVRMPSGRAIAMPSVRLTRRRLLQLAGLVSVGMGGGLLLHQWLRMQEYTVVTVDETGEITRCQQLSSPTTSGAISEFNVATVNIQDKIIPVERKQAEFRTEELGGGVTLDLMVIPGDSFEMGSPIGQGYDNERPLHEVAIQSFLMGKYLVTQAQWKEVAEFPKFQRDLDPDPSFFRGDNRPVESVSWDDAIEFCQRLSQQTGREYRLPSEAEWEYACRAGTTTPFHFGETITTDLANYRGTGFLGILGSFGQGPKGEYREETTPVGSFKVANAFGLYDMHGDVWEWCQDHWHNNYEGAPSDGSAWLSSDERAMRVLRGGSWIDYPRRCRSAFRFRGVPDNRNLLFSFRVCCSAPIPLS